MLTFEENENVRIGLIPCAVGGTSIDMWMPGANENKGLHHPYDDTIKRLRKAMRDGVIKGVIWHQGEADSRGSRANKYVRKLENLIMLLRKEVGNNDLPFIVRRTRLLQ